MRIGLVGEAPNDTDAIRNLLKKRYTSPDFTFFSMLDRMSGSLLDHQKTLRFLRIEYENKKPDLVIFIRDLDGLVADTHKVSNRKEYFSKSIRVVDKKGLFLLHIYEIEALILADIETFNSLYNCEIPPVDDPMMIEEPKEYLRDRSTNYTESDNPEIFEKIDFQKALTCRYFENFIQILDKSIIS